jgi:hypothetical protein
MADTGAPYFLPYPENTDLVRDGADAIKDLAEALAQALEDIPVTEKRIAAFTGSGTWTVPAGVTYAIAHMLGGGGGIGRGSTGGNGGASQVAFASGTVSANGGNKGLAGDFAMDIAEAGAANTGNAGVISSATTTSVRNIVRGSDAQYVVAAAAVTPAASITVTVGAGGTAGTSGAAGGSGYVYIEYYEEV